MTKVKLLVIVIVALITLYPLSIRAQSKAWERDMRAGREALGQDRLEEAEKWYQAAFKDAQKFDSSDSRLIRTLERLGDVYLSLGKSSDAEVVYQRLIKIAEKLMEKSAGANASGRIDRTLENINNRSDSTSVNFDELDYGLARRLLTDSLKNLAKTYQAQGKLSETEQTYLRLIEVLKKALSEPKSDLKSTIEIREKTPQTNQETVVVMSGNEYDLKMKKEELAQADDDLATLYLTQNKSTEAESLYQQSLLMRGDSSDSIDPGIAITLEHLAIIYASREQYDKAEPLFRRALTILEKVAGTDSPRLTVLLENYAVLLRKLGRQSESETMLLRAQKIREKNQK